MLTSQDSSVDPCENFFSHVCGNWQHTNSNHSKTTFISLLYDNMAVLRRLLEDDLNGDENSIKKQVQTFYASCMDTETLNTLGSQPLLEVIQEVGGWPGPDHWSQEDFNKTLQLVMSRFHTFPFFRAFLGYTPWDSSASHIQIDHPIFEIPLVLQHNDTRGHGEEHRKYLKYMKNLGELLGGDSSSQFIEEVYIFTSKLHEAVTPLQERIRKRRLYQRTTVQELQDLAPSVDWLTCLQETFQIFTLNSSQQIIVHDMDYLVSMSQIINQVQDRFVLQGYMVISLIQTLSPFLDERFLEVMDHLQRGHHQAQVVPRWERCLYETNTFFEPALSVMFVQATVSKKSERLAMEIFSHVKAVLHTLIGNLKWMDKKTQVEAQKQLQHVQIELTIPEKYKNTSLHIENKMTLKPGRFLWNALQLLSVQGSGAPWSIPPWSVYSHYSQRQNLLVFPAGILRPPIFHPHYPSAVNFGGLGFIMAHELIHSLLGYVLPILWGEMDGNVEEIHCLQEQYETLSVHNMTVNGSLTLLENMADVGGLYIAQQAHELWVQNHGPDLLLPDVGLTSQELFYTSYGQIMCGIQSPEDLILHLKADPHSPPELRVNGAVRNSPDFSNVFHCGARASMNPQHKCRVWV
ncbi:kell blood group glycoprotein isoform 2-T3 [Discoglossus pictus]